MNRTNKSLLAAAFRIAKSVKATALFIAIDLVKELPQGEPFKGCQIIYISRSSLEELETYYNKPLPSSATFLQLPHVDMTRISQIKMAVVLALSNQVIHSGDKIVFATGLPRGNNLDALFFLDTATESEILVTQGISGISECVNPEVFEETLEIALELAARGREGKSVGTIFVLGDEQKVFQLSKQMIINPFKGYTDEERNILNRDLRETLREFSAIDGAFVISHEGLVLSAGRYLGAASDEETIPRGLGSRHIAAAGITALTQAIAIVISESTGDVRIFKNGKILMEIEKPTTNKSSM